MERQFASMPVGCIFVDPEGRVSKWNSAAEKIFGFSEEDSVGRELVPMIVPEDELARVLGVISSLRRPGVSNFSCNSNITKDGRRILCEWSNTAIYDDDGVYRGYLSMVMDVTEKRRIEDSLYRLAAAVNQADETVVITDTHHVITYINPAFERITGYSAEEALGKTPAILKSGSHGREFYETIHQTLRRGDSWEGKFVNRRKDGSLFMERATISPVRDNLGVVVAYVAVKRDISKEMALEEQLRQSQKMEAVGRLAGGIAHDFNNILAAQRLQMEMLIDEVGSASPFISYLMEINKGLSRSSDLVSQLLKFSRRQKTTMAVLDINVILSEFVVFLTRLLGASVELLLNLSSSALHVTCDRGMLEQVFMNLCVNARDAMPSGGRLKIRTFAQQGAEHAIVNGGGPVENPDWTVVEIADTGVGMSRETLGRLFEPFFTTKEVGKGTGLGLAVVYGIIQEHNGYIKVESKVGEGSVFRIFLPRVAQAPEVAATDIPVPALRSRKSGATVLVVDDDDAVRKAVVAGLKKAGYRVHEARNGMEAIDTWTGNKDKIDLLFTDYAMPGGLSGMDIAKMMLVERKGLPVIISSGHSAAIVDGGITVEGNITELQKPYDIAALLDRVETMIWGADAPAES